MAGERRLYRHFGGFKVAYLTHHDDIRVLAQQRSHAVGKTQPDVLLNLHLIEYRFYHFDRIFHRADIYFRCGYLLQRGIKRGRLAGAGRAGHQNDAVRLVSPVVPQRSLFTREAKVGKILHQNFGIEDPHHQLLAKCRRHGGKPQLDLFAILAHRLDAAILGPALFHHVHAPEQLDAVSDGVGNGSGKLIDLVQHAVDAKAHQADFAARLQMDVAGALLESVLEQPIHQCNDVLFIGIQILVLAQLHQLLEILHSDGLTRSRLVGELHRIGKIVNFRQVVIDIGRVDHHQLDFQVEDAFQIRDPVGDIRLGCGDGHLMFADFDRHDL